MKNVLLIINPNSGRLKNKAILYNMIKLMSENDCIVTTRLTTKPGDADDFAQEACTSGRYDQVVCSGGDGTLNEVVSGILKSGSTLPIGYIPSGSTNDYAKSLGISSDIRCAINRAVCGKEHPIDIGRINDRYFNYIASFGAFTAASYNASRSLKKLLGHMAYILAGIKDATRIKPIHLKMECNGNQYEGDYIFGGVSNSTSIGGIVKIDEKLVGLNDGMFEVCLVKKPIKSTDAVKIIRAALKSDFESEYFEFFKANKLKITMSKEVPWSLDGEKYDGKCNTEVEILGGAVNLIL